MKSLKICTIVGLFLIFMSCKESGKKNQSQSNQDTTEVVDSSNASHSLTQNRMQRPEKNKPGIGPIKHEIKLGDKIDQTMAEKGKSLYENKCASCHRLHESATGPALSGVLEERSPQFVMNMILAPDEMIEKNAEVKAMKGQYEEDMINLHLTKKEARQIVEYLRSL